MNTYTVSIEDEIEATSPEAALAEFQHNLLSYEDECYVIKTLEVK